MAIKEKNRLGGLLNLMKFVLLTMIQNYNSYPSIKVTVVDPDLVEFCKDNSGSSQNRQKRGVRGNHWQMNFWSFSCKLKSLFMCPLLTISSF